MIAPNKSPFNVYQIGASYIEKKGNNCQHRFSKRFIYHTEIESFQMYKSVDELLLTLKSQLFF